MRVRLVIAPLLFFLPTNICSSKEDQRSPLEIEKLFYNDDVGVIDIDPNKTRGPAGEKTEVRRQVTELTDDNDYYTYPLCGDKPIHAGYGFICYCGNRTLSGVSDLRDGDYHCCVPPSAPGQEQCKPTDEDSPNMSDVRCDNGKVNHKTEPCHQNCWNTYTQSKKLYKTATLYCQEEEYCLPLDQMCSGVCREEAESCHQDSLRCIGDGYDDREWVVAYYVYPVKSLGTKLGKAHGFCLKINNDQVYDSVSRTDEVRVIGTNQPTVNYTGLVKCKDDSWGKIDGILCSGTCKTIWNWCAGTGDVCDTGNDIVSLDTPALCRNSTFWRINNFSCDDYFWSEITAVGTRCSGNFHHCTVPWYRRSSPYTYAYNNPICVDKSDQVFPINTTCRQYNKVFLETYRTLWCSGNPNREQGHKCEGRWDNGKLEDWFSQEDDEKISDPHGCVGSCKSTSAGLDCLACEHEAFFHCNSTGFCINKENVCDGHPHPNCGGDDENIYYCLDDYFKRRIVKRYATFICPSKMYPEMDTLAVVCDDNIECGEDRDEALCRTGADKYNPLVYAMTAATCLVYVVLKLVWFFHQRHQPVGDEGDVIEMEEMHLTEALE